MSRTKTNEAPAVRFYQDTIVIDDHDPLDSALAVQMADALMGEIAAAAQLNLAP